MVISGAPQNISRAAICEALSLRDVFLTKTSRQATVAAVARARTIQCICDLSGGSIIEVQPYAVVKMRLLKKDLHCRFTTLAGAAEQLQSFNTRFTALANLIFSAAVFEYAWVIIWVSQKSSWPMITFSYVAG